MYDFRSIIMNSCVLCDDIRVPCPLCGLRQPPLRAPPHSGCFGMSVDGYSCTFVHYCSTASVQSMLLCRSEGPSAKMKYVDMIQRNLPAAKAGTTNNTEH